VHVHAWWLYSPKGENRRDCMHAGYIAVRRREKEMSRGGPGKKRRGSSWVSRAPLAFEKAKAKQSNPQRQAAQSRENLIPSELSNMRVPRSIKESHRDLGPFASDDSNSKSNSYPRHYRLISCMHQHYHAASLSFDLLANSQSSPSLP
jgi:hypothetical protein